ncbi:MAG: hypothetical protein IIA35_06430 [Proteobacteria bacterium]|nr:hypothetical protein [Pseudomonadota bacterium]
MTDEVGITKTDLPAVAKQPNVYQGDTIRQVRARAESIPQDTSPEERDGLRRLNQILDQDRPLRDNVPRGFYLNIKI